MDKPTASQRAAMRHQEALGFAPSYSLPHHTLVSVEHPFIIKNVDKAIQTLGGLKKMDAVCLPVLPVKSVLTFTELVHENNQRAPAQLYMHPDDPMSKPLSASSIKTGNVVLQVTVPKRTGLKRRRGALDPYHEDTDQLRSSPSRSESVQSSDPLKRVDYLLRSLRDNAERYKVEAIGSIQNTHRFRRMVSSLLRPCGLKLLRGVDMPDFVYSTTNSPFMKKMRENILPFECMVSYIMHQCSTKNFPDEKMKNFKFDMSKGPQPNTDLVPPPRWSHIRIPFNYSLVICTIV